MKNNQANNKPITGNTLDYYNDDMSRKAVGKLFDNLDEFADSSAGDAGQDTSSIVVGYNDAPPKPAAPEYEPDYVQADSHRPADDRRPADPAMERAIERAAEIASAQTDGPRSMDDRSAGELRPADDRRPADESRADRADLERTHSRVFAEDYDMSLYRRNKPLLDNEEYEEILSPRRRARGPEPAVIRRAEPRGEPPLPPRRRPADGLRPADGMRPADGPRTVDSYLQADSGRSKAAPRPADSPRPTRRSADGLRPADGRAEPDDYIEKAHALRDRDDVLRAANSYHRTRMLMPYIAGIFVVLMIAMALLLFRISSVNKRLAEAEATVTELNTSIESYSTLQLKCEQQEKEIADLQARLDAAQASPPAETPGAASEPTQQQPAEEPATTLPTRYVVREGDNLSKISNKFYGSPNMFEKIKDANGLTTDTVMIGQTLTIPE